MKEQKIYTSPVDIFTEYARGQSYNLSITPRSLYDMVERNENFYIGKHWEGVNAPSLPKPVLNILKRVISYFVSTIVSDDVTARFSLYNGNENEDISRIFKIISEEIDNVIENNKLKQLNREALRNSAVDGDACLYCYFDADVKTNNITDGVIKAEIIDNTDVYFGNPSVNDVQKQPYILIAMHRLVGSVQAQAPDGVVITPDEENPLQDEKAIDYDKVTVIRKLWKQNGTIWVTDVTKTAILKPPTNLGYSIYPLSWFSWEKVKNCYHGISPMTPVIANQIEINKLFAMCIKHVKDWSFPKMVINKATFPDGINNEVGGAIWVTGDVNQAVMRNTPTNDMSFQVQQAINDLITLTKETMGASDAALGNMNADNTSAIIALQQSSAMPLELQKLSFYQFVEDYIRVIFDIITTKYGKRYTGEMVEKPVMDMYGQPVINENGMPLTEQTPEVLDYSVLKDMQLKLSVDIGATSYFSELAGIATLDNLFSKGILQDAVIYLESLPRGAVPNREKIISQIKEQQEQMKQQTQQLL